MPSSSRPWLLDCAFDCGSESFSDQWFGNVVEKSHLSTLFDINVGVVSADGDGPNRLHCAQFLHQVPSGAIGQAKVTEQHVEFDRFSVRERSRSYSSKKVRKRRRKVALYSLCLAASFWAR